jgi:xyloglucan-specific exo-beta-1,4-glucanase
VPAASGANFYVSTDSGHTFTKKSTIGSSTAPVKIVVHPSVAGDVWVSSDKGLFHGTNYGASFTAVSSVTQAWAFALGAPASTGGYPSIFTAANIGGIVGYFRSDNQGSTWVQINDVTHGFGSAAANVISGDPRKYGRCVDCVVVRGRGADEFESSVYIGTNGRGIFYVSGVAPLFAARLLTGCNDCRAILHRCFGYGVFQSCMRIMSDISLCIKCISFVRIAPFQISF